MLYNEHQMDPSRGMSYIINEAVKVQDFDESVRLSVMVRGAKNLHQCYTLYGDLQQVLNMNQIMNAVL